MMNRKILGKSFILLLALMQYYGGMAQHFRYSASIEPVERNGFYSIDITPMIASGTNESLADIRIHDAAGIQVPFIVKNLPGTDHTISHINFSLLSEGRTDNKQYFYIISNKSRHTTGDLILTFQNTTVSRYLSISGSDDEKDWYAIRENIALDLSGNGKSESFDQVVSLPLSNYGFYKITSLEKDLVPVKLLKAGIGEKNEIHKEWIPLPSPLVSTKDSLNQQRYYTLQFDAAYPVDQLILKFEGTPYFQRQLAVYDVRNLHSSIQQSVIRSSTPIVIPVGVKSNQLVLVVDNKDNPPLRLSSVAAFMEKKVMVAYLKGGETYSLLFGDSALTQRPSYDLGYFRDSIPAVLLQANLGSIEPVAANQQAVTGVQTTRKWITWLAIGTVLIILIFITARLTREVNESKDKTY